MTSPPPLLLIALATITYAYSQASEPNKLCYISSGNSDIHMPSIRSQYLFYGPQLAYIHYKSNHRNSKVTLTKFETTGTDLSLLDGIRQISADNCKAIVGLYTSRESLLAAPELKNRQLFALSVSASHASLNAWTPYIKTAAPSAKYLVEKMIKFSTKFVRAKNFIIQFNGDLYSKHYSELLSARLPNAKVIKISSGAGLSADNLNDVTSTASATIFLMGYSLPSITVLKQINDSISLKTIKIIGSPSWSFDLATFSSILDIKKIKLKCYFPETWDRTTPRSKQFIEQFKTTFHTIPQADAAYAYDATLVVLQCLDSKYKLNINKCLEKRRFIGVTGTLSYNKNDVFPRRKITFSNLAAEQILPSNP